MTGQTYEIAISISNSADLWLADVEIGYDTRQLYVMGTRSGSPVQVGELFAGTGAVIARNVVQNDALLFTVSKAGDVAPAPGNGVIGVFRVYPLASGTTQLLFRAGDLRQLNAARDGTDPVAFMPVLLELTITGDPVEIPTEATATPIPTATTASSGAPSSNVTRVPTLVNVTAAPQTPEPTALPLAINDPQNNSMSPLIGLGIGLVVLALVGLTLLFRQSRRSRKSSLKRNQAKP